MKNIKQLIRIYFKCNQTEELYLMRKSGLKNNVLELIK